MKMRGLAILLGGLAMANSAFAADFPPGYPPPYLPPVPVWNWNGCYVGGQVGYGWGNDRDNETALASGAPSPYSPATSAMPNGFLGGGYGGCNWQPWASHFVFGVEADAEWGNVRGSTNFGNTGTPADYYQSQIGAQAAIRGRIGYTFDRLLLYVAGGVAFADVNEHDVLAGAGLTDDNSTTAAGWTVGLGADYAFTPNWIGRVEYRYSDFGTFSYTPITFPAYVENHRLTENAVLTGLAYKFR